MLRPDLAAHAFRLYDEHCAPQRERYLAHQHSRDGISHSEDRWLIVVSNTHCERRATQGLDDAGFDVWWPTRMVEVKTRYMKRAEARPYPAFPGYLFVRSTGFATWQDIVGIDGIRAILCYQPNEDERCPLTISHAELDELRTRLAPLALPPVHEAFRAGDTVVIADGPFFGFNAVIEKICGKTLVEIEISVFGRLTKAQMEQGQIRKAS